MTLESSIRQAERSIAERRSRLGGAVKGVKLSVSERMVSPGGLVAAGLLGASLQRDNAVRMAALLQAINAGLRHLPTLALWTRPAVAAK